jgi:hypothetical protein
VETVPLKTLGVARRGHLELRDAELRVVAPSRFLDAWRIPRYAVIGVADLRPARPESDEVLPRREAALGHLRTGSAFGKGRVLLVFRSPQRVPSARWFTTMAGIGVRKSRGDGVWLDAVVVDPKDTDVALALLEAWGVPLVDDPVRFWAEHAGVVTDPAERRRVVDERAGIARRSRTKALWWAIGLALAGWLWVQLNGAGKVEVLGALVFLLLTALLTVVMTVERRARYLRDVARSGSVRQAEAGRLTNLLLFFGILGTLVVVALLLRPDDGPLQVVLGVLPWSWLFAGLIAWQSQLGVPLPDEFPDRRTS